MNGGVRKRGKSWSYFFYMGKVNGKKKMVERGGFRLKSEAKAALIEAISLYENGGFKPPTDTYFMEFALEWLENYVKPLRKIGTYNRYKELINKYLKDIGRMNISEIESYHIEKLLLQYRNTISNSTLQSIYTLINTIMNRALQLKIINNNPCKFVERPKRQKFTPDVLEVHEIKKLVSALDLSNEYDYMFYIALKITLELGLRRGELGGLEWSDIDFKEKMITVKNNLIYSNGHVYITTPKTIESNRSIYLSDELITLLKNLHIEQIENKLKYGQFYASNVFNEKKYDLIMKWENGKYIHPMNYPRKLKKTILKANIDKNVRFHDLRHTNATLLISQGVDFKTVQTRLGHKDINTTLNIYSHANKKMQQNATDELSKLLNF